MFNANEGTRSCEYFLKEFEKIVGTSESVDVQFDEKDIIYIFMMILHKTFGTVVTVKKNLELNALKYIRIKL